jgi:hypothetical protein
LASSASAALPVVEETDVVRRTDTSVHLVGYLNPGDEPTTYHFEYGTTTSYGSEVPMPAGDAGSGGEAAFVSQPLPNLSPGTSYHYRLVATNGSGTSVGPDQTFTTRGDAAVFPARTYERISPTDKNDYEVNVAPVMSTDREGGVMYVSWGPFPGSQSGAALNPYLARRGPSGWSFKPVNPPGPPRPTALSFGVSFYSADLSSSVISAPNPAYTPEAFPDGVGNTYILDNETAQISGTVTEATKAPVVEGINAEATTMGASDDLDHVVFIGETRLLPEAPEEGIAVYRWSRGSGLEVISVDHETGLPISGTRPVETLTGLADLNMVSGDGKRAFFKTADGLYLWEEGAGSTLVSASQRSEPDPAGPQAAQFQLASEDGSRVFFTSSEKLVDGDPDNSPDLYLFDAESGDLRRVTGDGSEDPAGAGARTVAGISRDGSQAYFVAQGALAAGAVSGNNNLYLWEETASGGGIVFLGTGISDTEAERLYPRNSGSRTSLSGRYFAFESAQSLTGLPAGENQQVYLYDGVERELACVSCGLAGGLAAGPAALGSVGAKESPTSLLEDGQLFFDTPQALVGIDTNNRRDVYVYRNGHTRLISTGKGNFDAVFGDASKDGTDVYFVTHNRLVPADVDAGADLYDARVGGGFPEPPVQPAPCSGSACQGQPSTSPAWRPPGDAGPQPGGGKDCAARARQAQRLDARAARLARVASRLRSRLQDAGGSQISSRAKKAARQAGKAKRQAAQAKAEARRCRGGGSR